MMKKRILDVVLENPGIKSRQIAMKVGLKSWSTVLYHLRGLKEMGLVTWEEGKVGTLRAYGRIKKSGHITGYIAKIGRDVYHIKKKRKLKEE